MVDTSGLSDSLQQRLTSQLQATRNPNVSTDAGTNSASPYFLGATPTSSARTINNLSQSWSNTSGNIAAIDADTKAKQDAYTAQQAAAQAAKQAQAMQQKMQAGLIAQDAANQKRLQQLYAAAGQHVTGTAYPTTYTGATSSGGFDSQSASQLRIARSYGYNLNQSNYSKSYTYDPTIDAARNKAMALSSSYLGTSYVLGGTSHQGIDCSGLVMSVYNQLGYNINQHHATWQRDNIPGQRVAWGSPMLKKGDLIAWKDGSHIAVYAGNGRIIEAANTKVGTVERPLWANPDAVVGIHLAI